MPDYGLRPPPYVSGDGILGNAPYGWAGTPDPSVLDTPYSRQFPMAEFVYERLDWNKFKQQLYREGGPGGSPANTAGYYSNPPFMGAGQMTGPNGAPSWMRGPDGGVQRILRGYLRRQRVDPTQPESFVRLYFMYNPDQVSRQYLSWSDDTTADISGQFGEESSSSPAGVPSMTTMSFTLYFDRQLELMNVEDHPGVMVDLQTFDVLSGNLVYRSPTGGNVEVPVLPPGMTLPDNTDLTDNRSGQIQPKVSNVATTVTAVFSPSLAVEGVLSGASVTFSKFSKRMTPSTMALNITLMVVYAGKANNQSYGGGVGAGTTTNPQVYDPGAPGYVPPATQTDRNYQTKQGAIEAVNYGNTVLLDTGTDGHYDNSTSLHGQMKRDIGPPCTDEHPFWTDCSAFVWRCFHAVGWTGTDQGDLLGLGGKCGGGAPNSEAFATNIRRLSSGTNRRWKVWQDMWDEDPPNSETSWDTAAEQFEVLRRGDVLVRLPGYVKESGHVAFFVDHVGDLTGSRWNDDDVIQILDSGGKNMGSYKQGAKLRTTSMSDIWKTYNIWARPEPFGPTTDFDFNHSGSVTP